MNKLLSLLLLLLISPIIYGQTTITGTIKDGDMNEPMYGAAVVVQGTTDGATTDFDGNFELITTANPPFNLEISFMGFETKVIPYLEDNIGKPVKVSLGASAEQIGVVEVIDIRVTEKQQESPLTIESMGLKAIKETPSSSFYNGLGNLKGVDLTTASLGFVVINTRGFNSTRPVRSLQMVDGADNQAPGLNFSLGNFAGSSELDIQKVDLIVGASSALYGPNAFNGVIDMHTKNPFYHQGLSVLVKGGERGLFETAVRYARAFENAEGVDKFAFKINFSYMRANDWEANNFDPTEQSEAGAQNFSGFDAVNIYGDEDLGARDYSDDRFSTPGMDIVYRTGYAEENLLDYNVRNYKTNAALHYRITDKIETSVSYNFGAGTTVYHGDNRYSLNDLLFHQVKWEIGERDKWFIRAYHTRENAGNSYDAVFTGLLLQEGAKQDDVWHRQYASRWIQNYSGRVLNLPGYPDPNDPNFTQLWFGETRDSIIGVANDVMAQFSDSLNLWHAETRAFVDSSDGGVFNGVARYEPGTARFDSALAEVQANETFLEGGSGFFDKSALTHVQAEYKFTPQFMDITVGGSFRYYQPNSNGTVFIDTSGRTITNWEAGMYLGLQKRLLADRLILTATGRVDKNENFKVLVSPAASAVYKVNLDHVFRASFSSAIRNPTLQDQFLFYNVGRAILIGNLEGINDLFTVESFESAFGGQTFVADSLEQFDVPPVRPEQVRTLELGYKAVLGKKVFVDLSYFYSWYKDFLGFKIGLDSDIDTASSLPTNTQVYRVSANSPDRITTQGFSIGVNYYFIKNFQVFANYSWNKLDRQGSTDPIIPAFNTPEHKFNVGISGSDIELGKAKYFGFNVNYKWIEGFLFEGSPQFTGSIPTYSLVDMQVNYRVPKIYTTIKVGATNILNNKVFQVYGGPRVGRMVYASLLFEFDKI